MDSQIEQGHYAKKQILLKDRLISWSHRSRFETGLRLASQHPARCVLDYGCGDGTLLALLAKIPGAFQEAVGCELDPKSVDDCTKRLTPATGIRFYGIPEMDTAAHTGRYDLILCMEVLEHVVDLDVVLDRLERLLAPDGKLIISVPVEIGPALLLKQTARRIAGWRGLGDYPGTSPYQWKEIAAALVAGPAQHITRPVHRNPDGSVFHCHKGFNWRSLRERLERRFHVESQLCSPVAWLPPGMASQVWFVLSRGRSS